MKFAVCIPCVKKHQDILLLTIKFIEAQTRKPDLIVISISDTIDDPVYDTNIINSVSVPTTIKHTNKRLYAGANRNIAAAEAVKQGATHISFFDADDIMHPQRLECIERAFTEHPELVGFLHCFLCGSTKNMAIYRGEIEFPWEPISNDFMPKIFEPGEYYHDIIKFQYCFARPRRGYGMAANGHISVLADFWQENPYLETAVTGEDNHFSCSILRKKKMLGYTGDTLSVYMRNDVANFQIAL